MGCDDGTLSRRLVAQTVSQPKQREPRPREIINRHCFSMNVVVGLVYMSKMGIYPYRANPLSLCTVASQEGGLGGTVVVSSNSVRGYLL